MSEDIKELTISSSEYPALLKQINHPPAKLYYRGNLAILHNESLLAIVGSRKAGHYGAQCIKDICTPLVQAGVPLVSGLAYGIDSLAHRLCVKHQKPTVAVLGSGLDNDSIYPKRHHDLADQIIASGGIIVSEHPAGTPAIPRNFPARNRIIAGLCRATLIIQAAKRSGSLITARLALEEGREVCAVPGAITDPLSVGTNNLIKQGATPVTCAQDMFDTYNITDRPEMAKQDSDNQLSGDYRIIVGHLSHSPLHIDQIIEKTGLATALVSGVLLELELQGVVENHGQMQYSKKE